MEVTEEGRAPLAVPHATSAVGHTVDTPAVQSPVSPMGNLWESLGIHRHKSKQPASWSRKATELNPQSPSWYLIPLFQEVRRKPPSFSKKEVAVSQQLSELKDFHTRAGHKKLVLLPSTRDHSELAPYRKVPLSRGFSSEGEGSCSNFLCWMFHLQVPHTKEHSCLSGSWLKLVATGVQQFVEETSRSAETLRTREVCG